MVYLVSDLHGMYAQYLKLLERINFSDKDQLYILGDIADRGPYGAQLYLDIIQRKNVFCILGNHDRLLLEALPHYFCFLQREETSISSDVVEIWGAVGGDKTFKSLMEVAGNDNGAFNEDIITQIYRFIEAMPCYREIEVYSDKYLLLHAGIENYDRTKPISKYKADELIGQGFESYIPHSFDFNGRYYDMQYRKIIVGHTPTYSLNFCKPPKIFFGGGNVVDIDCGAPFENGRLGCLCLDTMEETYID